MVSKVAQLLLIWGISLLQGALAGDLVLIGPPDALKEFTSLQEASYASQENSSGLLSITE